MYANIKRALMGFAAAAVLGSGLMAVSATTAQATTTSGGQSTCDQVDTRSGSGTCAEVVPSQSQSEAHASTDVTNTTVNGVDIHKAKVVAFVQAKGATKAQMQGKKLRLKKAKRLWTSYINTSGQEVWHWKHYRKHYKFVKGSDGYFHDPNCWNKVAIKHKKPGVKIHGKIKIVKKFKFEVSAIATVSDHVKAHAIAWANATGCHAEAEANATASFNAEASASVRGRVLVTVLAQAKAAAQNNLSVKLKGKTLVDIHADVIASATGKATADAKAQAKCEATTPPPSYKAPSVSASAEACVKPGEKTGVVNATGINPNSVAAPGSFVLGNQNKDAGTVPANGTVTAKFTGLQPGTYTVVFTLGSPVNQTASTQVVVNECEKPPVVPTPKLIDVDTINDVLINNTRTITVTGTVAPNHTAALVASAKNGGSITVGKSQTVKGNFTATVTYKAPSEVPGANGDIAAGKDRVDFVLTQDDGQSASISTNQFVIQKPNPDPL